MGCDLLLRQPAAGRECKFELVAIELRLFRAQDGADRGQLDFADSGQLILDLRLLQSQLFVVGQVLPLATATHAEVLAERLATHLRKFLIANHIALHIAAAFVTDLNINDIARYGHRNENDLVVPASERLTFGGKGCYFEPLDQGILVSFTCHDTKICVFVIFGKGTQKAADCNALSPARIK